MCIWGHSLPSKAYTFTGTYPADTRESEPTTTPPSNSTAMMVVCRERGGDVRARGALIPSCQRRGDIPREGGDWLRVTQKFRPEPTPSFHCVSWLQGNATAWPWDSTGGTGTTASAPPSAWGSFHCEERGGGEAPRGRSLAQGNYRLHHRCLSVQVWET